MDMKANGLTRTININKSDKNCAAAAAIEPRDLVHHSSTPPSKLDNGGGASLSPITPDSNVESMDVMPTFKSPLVSSPHSHQTANDSCTNEYDDGGPCTPREGVFDPFAPAPDKLMMAPHCLKYLEEYRRYVARRLNFNSLDEFGKCEEGVAEEYEDEDDMLVDTVYDSLLEAIICQQAEDILVEMSSAAPPVPDDVLKTPPSAPRFTGIADTCPAAPLKPVSKSRSIDLSFCRKLEF